MTEPLASFTKLQQDYQITPYLPITVRRAALQQLKQLLQQQALAIAEAIHKDFGYRVQTESLFLEIYPTIKAIDYCLKHLKQWMKKRKRRVAWYLMPASAYVLPQPVGVVGIVVPWNYPIFLSLVPLAYALAAGNRVMVNLSEQSKHTAQLLDKLISALQFDHPLVKIMQGDIEFAKQFVALPFGHLLFTGSTKVGKQVMAAASANLTPITLELGGKSPAIVAASLDKDHLERLFMGKLFNAGQTCIAPDYLLVARPMLAYVEQAFKEFMLKRFADVVDNDDYTSIITEGHQQRLQALIDDAQQKGARLIQYGQNNSPHRKMPVYMLMDVDPSMSIMQEEIFGPLLPVIVYDSFNEALRLINNLPNPLSLYYFGNDQEELDQLKYHTLSGALTVNQTIMHVAINDLPFGGVGYSGMGQYHGREGFDAFSQLKPIMIQHRFSPLAWFYPPYGKLVRWYLRYIGKIKC